MFAFSDELNNLEGPNRVIVPFLACGDLSGFDSDKTYPLKVNFAFVWWGILFSGCLPRGQKFHSPACH